MAGPARRIAGTCYFKIDGQQLELEAKLTVSIASVAREGQAGLSGVAGYVEKPQVPYIEGAFFVTSGFPMATIEKMTSGTITAELGNGTTAVLSEAWFAGNIEVDAAAGTVGLKFEGLSGQWI